MTITTPNIQDNLPVVVGITGASGTVLGFRLVEALLLQNIPVELIMSEKTTLVMTEETGFQWTSTSSLEEKAHQLAEYLKLPEPATQLLKLYPNSRLDMPTASGTHLTRGMVIIPCSMGTLARIANGLSDNLLARSADVTLKENRKLILVPRETPLNAIHLENMLKLSRLGVSIIPPMLAFYLKAFDSMDGQINYTLGKVLDHLGLFHQRHPRWRE
jgi:4-hydroxy-3-polyprenylbenzoate decarboxylase